MFSLVHVIKVAHVLQIKAVLKKKWCQLNMIPVRDAGLEQINLVTSQIPYD